MAITRKGAAFVDSDTGVVQSNAVNIIGAGVAIRATLNGVSPGVLAAAGDYAAGDILSDDADNTEGHAWVFDDAARDAGGSGWIVKVLATASVDALVPRLRVWFFKSSLTTSELDDNAAAAFTVADRGLCVGYIDLPALADIGTMSFAQNTTDRLFFQCSGDDRLYAVLQTLDAFTNESASMSLDLWIGVERS